jgi:multiple antibiotic resistance protein
VNESFILEVGRASVALFIIVDPLGNVPVFMSLTHGMTPMQRKRTLRTATIVAFALLLVFALVGQRVLEIFGISLYSFMIAGGILLLFLAMKMLVAGKWEEAVSPEDVGAVPIAFPLLVGPGAITSAMMTLQSSGLMVTLISVIIVFGITWFILNFIERIHSLLGKTGSAVVSRVMAVFLAAIAVGFIINGVKHSF